MALGPLGRKNVPVGETPIPLGAFANLIGVLAANAASEYNAAVDSAHEGVPSYLVDSDGNLKCDLTEPHERAQVLWETLGAEDEQSSDLMGFPNESDYWANPEAATYYYSYT